MTDLDQRYCPSEYWSDFFAPEDIEPLCPVCGSPLEDGKCSDVGNNNCFYQE